MGDDLQKTKRELEAKVMQQEMKIRSYQEDSEITASFRGVGRSSANGETQITIFLDGQMHYLTDDEARDIARGLDVLLYNDPRMMGPMGPR